MPTLIDASLPTACTPRYVNQDTPPIPSPCLAPHGVVAAVGMYKPAHYIALTSVSFPTACGCFLRLPTANCGHIAEPDQSTLDGEGKSLLLLRAWSDYEKVECCSLEETGKGAIHSEEPALACRGSSSLAVTCTARNRTNKQQVDPRQSSDVLA